MGVDGGAPPERGRARYWAKLARCFALTPFRAIGSFAGFGLTGACLAPEKKLMVTDGSEVGSPVQTEAALRLPSALVRRRGSGSQQTQ